MPDSEALGKVHMICNKGEGKKESCRRENYALNQLTVDSDVQGLFLAFFKILVNSLTDVFLLFLNNLDLFFEIVCT